MIDKDRYIHLLETPKPGSCCFVLKKKKSGREVVGVRQAVGQMGKWAGAQ